MHRRTWLTLLLLCCALWIAGGDALANGSPPRWQGDQAGVIMPGSTTQVHVRRERLQFDLTAGHESAVVTAQYDMENPGGALAAFPVVFVIEDGARGRVDTNVQVTWNGKPLPVQTKIGETTHFVLQAWGAMETVIDPVSGKPYSSKNFFGSTELRFAEFALDLPAGGTGTLEVRYNHNPAQDRDRLIQPIYHYQYLLLPAKGWASFGPIDIQVKLKDQDNLVFASTIPMQKGDGEYRTTLSGLPSENLAFAVMSRRGMLFGVTNPNFYYVLSFLLLLAVAVPIGMGLGALAGRLRSKGWAVVTGLGLGALLGGLADGLMTVLIFSSMAAVANQGYGLVFMGLFQGLGVLLVTIVVAGVAASRTHRRRQVAP